jgi:methionyl-tRNA synthetase
LALVDATNRFIEVTAPFKLAKDPTQRDRLGTILYNCAEALRLALVYLAPIMPQTSPRGLTQLGWQIPAGQTFEQIGQWGVLRPGTKVIKGEGLFPRKA